MNKIPMFTFISLFNRQANRNERLTISNYNAMLKRLMGDRLIRKLDYSIKRLGSRNFKNYEVPVDLAIISVLGYRKALVSKVLTELDPSATDLETYFIDKYLHKYNLFLDVDNCYIEPLLKSFNEGYVSVFEMSVLVGIKRATIDNYLANIGLIEIVNEGLTRRLTKANASSYCTMIDGYRKWSLVIFAAVIVINYLESEV